MMLTILQGDAVEMLRTLPEESIPNIPQPALDKEI
jgi:hypothetical protein